MTFRPYVGYDPPCSGKSMPGTMNLAYVLTMLFDESISMGIYNCRPPSTHSDGRAYDMGFRGYRHPQGYAALAVLINHAWDLGITELIWARMRYTAAHPEGVYYGGVSPHDDHIHIGHTPALAASLTQAQAFAILEETMLTPAEENFVKEMYAAAVSLEPDTNGSFVYVLVKLYRAIRAAVV